MYSTALQLSAFCNRKLDGSKRPHASRNHPKIPNKHKTQTRTAYLYSFRSSHTDRWRGVSRGLALRRRKLLGTPEAVLANHAERDRPTCKNKAPAVVFPAYQGQAADLSKLAEAWGGPRLNLGSI